MLILEIAVGILVALWVFFTLLVATSGDVEHPIVMVFWLIGVPFWVIYWIF